MKYLTFLLLFCLSTVVVDAASLQDKRTTVRQLKEHSLDVTLIQFDEKYLVLPFDIIQRTIPLLAPRVANIKYGKYWDCDDYTLLGIQLIRETMADFGIRDLYDQSSDHAAYTVFMYIYSIEFEDKTKNYSHAVIAILTDKGLFIWEPQDNKGRIREYNAYKSHVLKTEGAKKITREEIIGL